MKFQRFEHISVSIAIFVVLLPAACSAGADIAINYPAEEHGLYYTTPASVWDEALPLGNGIMGALVWGDGNPLKVSLGRADLWDLRLVPEFYSEKYKFRLMREWHQQGHIEDLVRFYEQPYHRPAPTRIPAGRIEWTVQGGGAFLDASLSLMDATARVRLSGGADASLMVHAVEPLGMISVRSANRISARLIAPLFGGKLDGRTRDAIGSKDLAQLGYPAPTETSGEGWTAFVQEGAEGYHFAVYVAWKERADHWEGAWSVASCFEGKEPLRLAKQRVRRALEQGYESMAVSHRRWWSDYWHRSSVRLPNPILERQWFLEQYKFGSAARRGAPPISLQAVWTADDGKLPPWKSDYHHDLNTQLSYWPCYSGNHLEEGLTYLDYLWNTRKAAVAWTRRFFELPGLNVPMSADLNGNQIGGWRQYAHSATTAAWLAHHFYLHWKYSADRVFLRERAYPYLHDAAVFLEAFTAHKDYNGLRTFPMSSSPEIYDNRPEAWFPCVTNYDLALSRWLFGAAAELADELERTRDVRRWRSVLSELPELSLGTDGSLLLAEGHPLSESHRHLSHLMAIYPLGLIDLEDGQGAQKTIEASLAHLDRLGSGWWMGYSFSWLANLAARARDGERAAKALEIFSTAFTLRNSFHCNGDQSGKGYSKETYRPFTLEGNFAAAAAVQEMLLQSHRGKILLFPAIPNSWKDVSFTTLRAQGAFLISAQRQAGATSRVEITSERGGTCVLVSPFTGKELKLAMKPGQRIVLTSDPAE